MTASENRQPGAHDALRAWKERRDQARVDLHLPIAFHEVAARPPVTRHGLTLNVSRAGVRFRSGDFLPPGSFISLEVSLPVRGTYAARGRAVWARESPGNGHWEVGAEFLRSGGDDDAALAEALLLAT